MTLFAQVWRIIHNYWKVKVDFFLIVHQGPETRQSYRGASKPIAPRYVVLQAVSDSGLLFPSSSSVSPDFPWLLTDEQ